MDDPYGLMASGLPPEMAAELMGLKRRQAIADALMQQSMATNDMPTNKGQFESKVNPLQPLVKMATAYFAGQQTRDTDKKYADLASRQRQAVADAMTNYEQQKSGSPAQTIPQTAMSDEGEGNTMLPPAVKDAVAGNPRAAITQALLNPLLAKSPLVTADMKSLEKANDPFSLKPGEQRYAGNQVVAKGAAPIAEVTAAGPGGVPVTRFVAKEVGAPDVPQPIKAEYKDLGGTIAPVPAFVDPTAPPTAITKTESPDTVAHVAATVRGQNMVDARTRELNGILEGQSTDLGPTADAVANYDIPLRAPPSNARPAAMAQYNKLISAVKERNPDWNAPDYDASRAGLIKFTSGPQGNIVRSLSVVQEHGQTMRDAAQALNNGDLQLLNRAGNAISAFTGNPAPTNFDAVKNIYKDEITKAVLGSSGALGDREAVDKTMSRVNSPQQLIGVMDHYDELMRGQLRGLKRQYEETTKRKDFDRFLSDRAKAVEYGTAAPASAPAASGVFDQADAILRGGK